MTFGTIKEFWGSRTDEVGGQILVRLVLLFACGIRLHDKMICILDWLVVNARKCIVTAGVGMYNNIYHRLKRGNNFLTTLLELILWQYLGLK